MTCGEVISENVLKCDEKSVSIQVKSTTPKIDFTVKCAWLQQHTVYTGGHKCDEIHPCIFHNQLIKLSE